MRDDTSNEVSQLESTPIKFLHQGNGKGLDAVVQPVEGQNQGETLFMVLKQLTGVKDSELASNIIDTGASAIDPIVRPDDRLNVIAQALHDFEPRDAIEARLVTQSTALFLHGMMCLRRTETAEKMPHSKYYANKAIKLLRLHNETIETLNKHRRRGEQKITVQHSVVADKAIVNFPGGGVNTKNGGKNPCSEDYAEQKQEPAAIDHVDNPPWPMGDVGCTEESVRDRKQKREKDD